LLRAITHEEAKAPLDLREAPSTGQQLQTEEIAPRAQQRKLCYSYQLQLIRQRAA
jgi:hypothetical protein